MQFIIQNFSSILGVLGAILGVVVLVLHLAHKDDVAAKIQGIEDTLAKLAQK